MSNYYRGRDRDGRNGGARSNSFRNSTPNRVNPWEGGVAPGRPLGGLLPTPTLGNAGGGLLQQLSTQEAQTQLAIASNMLNVLLPTLHSSPSQVPPLLNMNPNRGGLLPLSSPRGPAFQGQAFTSQPSRLEDIGPNRHRSHPSSKRPEPYKVTSRNQRPGSKFDDHKGAVGSSRGGGRSPALSSKKQVQQSKASKSADAKKNDARNDAEKLDKKKVKESRDSVCVSDFADIPSELLSCHVCKKRMWDATSFTNHLRGRAHQLMLDQLEESYKIKIDLMRHEMKVDEQQRQIEMLKKQRQGKAVGSQSRDYCIMCDLNFIGTLSMHRKSELHQKLKYFLHPKCSACSEEFCSRLEWDQHQLTPVHLKRMVGSPSKQLKDNSGHGVKSNSVVKDKDNSSMKYSSSLKDSSSMKDDLGMKDNSNMTDNEGLKNNLGVKDNPTVKEISNIAEVRTKTEVDPPKESSEVSIPKPVVSLNPSKSIEMPIKSDPEPITLLYDASREIGSDMLQEKTGFLCRCCNRFISSQMDAKTHCRSRYHYDNYISYLKNSTLVIDSSASGNKTDSKPENQREESQKGKENSNNQNVVKGQIESSKVGNSDVKDCQKQTLIERSEEEDREEEVNWKRRRISTESNQVIKADTGICSDNDPSSSIKTNDNNTETSSIKSEDTTLGENSDENKIEESEEPTLPDKEKSISEIRTPRARRGRGGSAVRSRSRKRK